jgi:serine/threonine protein kinase
LYWQDITRYIQRDPNPKYRHPIGSGASGDVYKAIYKAVNPQTREANNIHVVIKVLAGTTYDMTKLEERLNREIACWRHLKHPNVTELLGIADFLPGRPPGLVSKLVQRHNFLEYIGRHPELKREKAQEIAAGVKYLHDNNMIHGDIKANNILVSNRGVAQITDFGLAQILDVRGFTTMTQRNVRFTAPELMPLVDNFNRPTRQSDIFSLGILLLQLFHGPDPNRQRGLPYNHIAYSDIGYDIKLMKRVCAGDRPRRDSYNYILDQHWALICWCWDDHPDSRPTILQVCHAL